MACRGSCLAAPESLPLARPCRGAWCAAASFSWGALVGLPGELLSPGPWCFGLVVPASSSCRGLVSSARQAPLAGVSSSWLKYLVFVWPGKDRGDSWRSPGKPCRRVLLLSVHKFGVLRYPNFSTPTGAPGPGPYTVPSVVGPGPNSARARVAWVALHLNSAPVAPSLSGARLSQHRGGEACEVCVTWAACAGLSLAGIRHVEHDFFIWKG